jgi:hypothetical protein
MVKASHGRGAGGLEHGNVFDEGDAGDGGDGGED